jgi:DNA-binding CsgD family transcriptional regulator
MSLGCATGGLALDDIEHGRAEQALAEAGACAGQMAAVGSGVALAFLMRAIAYAQAALGSLEAAEATFAQLHEAEQGMMVIWDQWVFSWRARIARLSGNLELAQTHATHARELATRTGNPAFQAFAMLELARVAAARDEFAAAEAVIHEAIELALPGGVRPMIAEALAALAVVAGGLESYEEAARLLGASDRALADLDGRIRWKHEQAAMDELHTLLDDRVGPEPHAEGRELSLENAVGWARRARGQRKRPSGGWESLTPTELHVVELACEGLTNAAIGERMFISGATVKVHLAHVYAKLDVPNRAALATLAARRTSTVTRTAG